jgi:hypothetical protein
MLNIGGFFELEIPGGREFHSAPYRFALGRHALAAILLQRNIKTLYVPEYLCESLLDAAHSVGAEARFYGLRDLFNPNLPDAVGENEAVLLLNYFGLVDMERLLKKVSGRAIVDNSQSFFSHPINGVDTFYSPRKFFGVPDGSYLYTDLNMDEWFAGLPVPRSYPMMQHLVDRLDGCQESGYQAFQRAKQHYRNMPMSKMSETSRRMLSSINYRQCQDIRLRNFDCLKRTLKQFNEIDPQSAAVPMYYPLLVQGGKELRARLIQKGIFIPMYWPYVLAHSQVGSAAHRLVEDLVCLPIDHRYSENQMELIAAEVTGYFGS